MENKNWPDKIRLQMIEKSELYKPDERIYQYGYYDGYQVGRDETIQKCLTILGEHIKGGYNNKSFIGKILKSFKYNTTEKTILNAYNELRKAIKNI